MVDRPTALEDPLDGRTALVTDASSGIGAVTARVPAEDGADMCLAARRVERLESLADEIRDATGATVSVVPTDVTDSDAIRALVDATVERFGLLGIVVCNAGPGIDKPVAELTDEEYRLMTGANVDGMFYTAREAPPRPEASEGNLVFLGSMSGNYPRPRSPVYATAKWWVRGFAPNLQRSVGEENVGVTCVNPTEAQTEFGSESGETFEASFEEGEVTEAIEMADAIAYAVRQRSPNTVLSLDLYRRDKLSHL